MTTTTFAATHVQVTTAKAYGEVTNDFERQLGKFDPTVLPSLRPDANHADDVRSRIEAMAGPSGLMLFGTIGHGTLLSVFAEPRKAVQYVVGNPLIALQMTQHDVRAGLYAPLRMLIYEDEQGNTCLEYDQPSSLFGQFDDDRITSVANQLDRKMEELVRAAVS